MSYPIPCAKAWNSALPNSRIESRFSPKLCSALATVQPCLIHCLMPKPVKAVFPQSSVPLWQRDSLVLSNSLCQSLEFSLTEFQDRKPFFPKALFRFGNGTALSYPLPYAKACKGRFLQSSVPLWQRYSLVLSIALCQSLEFSFAEFQDRKPFFPKALFRFGTGTAVGLFFFQTQPPVKSQAHKAGVKKSSLLREPYILQFKIFKSLAGFFYRFPVSERTEPYKALSRGTESNPRSCNHMALA